MASQTPYARLTGVWKFYLAAASTAAPALDASPSGSWTELAQTDGEQTLNWKGSLTMFSDNHTNAPVKHVRPEEGFGVAASLVHMTLENLATVFSMAAASVVTTTSGALDVKRLPLKRGFIPQRFALLARGGAVTSSNVMSAYLAGPAQLYIPIGVFDGEPSPAFSKDGSPAVEFEFVAEHDDAQSAGLELGYLMMQSS